MNRKDTEKKRHKKESPSYVDLKAKLLELYEDKLCQCAGSDAWIDTCIAIFETQNTLTLMEIKRGMN